MMQRLPLRAQKIYRDCKAYRRSGFQMEAGPIHTEDSVIDPGVVGGKGSGRDNGLDGLL